MKLPLPALAAAFLALGCAPFVHADVLHLKNGDTLTGKVLSHEGGKVRLKGDLFGEVTVSDSDVASFQVGETAASTEAAAPATAAAPLAAGSAATGAAAGAGSSNFQGQQGAPDKPVWSSTITFGGSYNSAIFEQGQLAGAPPGVTGGGTFKLPGRTYSMQTTASFVRTTQSDAHSLDLSETYSDSQPNGKIADNYSAIFAWNHKLTPRTYTVSRSSYSVDKVKNIDYSASQIFGYGYKVVDTAQTKFDLVPGVLLLQEEKGSKYDGDLVYGAGILENLTYYFNQFASFDQRVLYRRSIQHSDLYLVDAYAGFKGMLSAKLGVTLGVTYTYDNTLGPLPAPYSAILAQKKGILQTTYGLQYKF